MGRVAVVGSLNVDLVARVARHPRPGETIIGQGPQWLPGGKGANQAVAAAAAGAEVDLIGRVGTDEFGSRYLAGLAEQHVDVTHVLRTPEAATGTAHIAVDEASENSIIVLPGANALLTPSDVDNVRSVIERAEVLLLQLEIPVPTVVRAAEIAVNAGRRVVLNAAPALSAPGELLRLADPVLVNEHEAAYLGEAGSVCVTLGARGAEWRGTHAEAPVVAPVDTTGAGDAFAGTLAARLAGGDEPAAALRAAVRAGAAATLYRGAQDWTFDG